MHPIPVFIVSGFLGAGKTTLLNYILNHQKNHKIAIIENEFGNTAIDTKIIACNDGLHITTLKNGCICCSSYSELQKSLTELLIQLDSQQIHFTQLIIECTGIADPTSIIHTFFTHDSFSKRFDLKGTIVIVDAINAVYHFQHFNVTQAQIAIADLILLSKTDLLQKPLEPFLKQLHYMNRTAPIHIVQQGKFDLELLHNLNSYNISTLAKHTLFTCTTVMDDQVAYDTKINSFVIHREKAFDSEKLSQLIDRILNIFQNQLIRYKGILNIQGKSNRLILQGIQQLYNSEWGEAWHENENPYSEIVFIGIQLPEHEFRYFFDNI